MSSSVPFLTGFTCWLACAVTALADTPVLRRGVNPLANQPPVVLAGPGTSPAPILIAADATAQEKQAAEQLEAYLSKIGGVEFSVATALDDLPDRAVLVGDIADQQREDISREGFVIRTEGRRLRIRGGTPHATLFAVFALLEEQLGCRWWSWNEEEVPHRATIEIAAQDTHIEPAFQRHDLYNREAQNRQNFFAYKLRTISLTNFTGGHNLCPLLKPASDQHPEFLPMDDRGERKFNNLHMNYTADGVAEALADALRPEIEKRGGVVDGTIYFAGMGDWYGGMDLSPESKRIYEEEKWIDPDGREKPGYSATLLRMINRTAELLDKDYPGIQVGTFAYMSLESPPAVTRPRHNVAIRLPRLRHDTVRSIVESEKNRSYRRNLDRWVELAPGRVYIWEYGANFQNFLRPFPCLRSLAANIQYYDRLGVAGISIQGNYVSTGGDLAVLKNYVWAHLLWDPSRDVEGLVREFCEGYYGPAADDMLAYVTVMEDSVRGEEPISADEFDTRLAYLTPERVEQAQAIFQRALAKTQGGDSDPFYRRIKEAEVGLEAHLLWKDGPLVEDGERLIRADLGGDTFPRARDLVRYCRDASPREWGNGHKYRMSFLTMHGGPMLILRQEQVTAKIAPVQNGQIRAVLLGDRVAIDGCRIALTPDSVTYDVTAREEERVRMQGVLGVGMWSPPSGTQTAWQTIEMADDGCLACSVQVASNGNRAAENRAVYESVYQVGAAFDRLSISYEDATGAWQSVRVDGAASTVAVPRAVRLRIGRPVRGVQIDDRYHGPAGDPTARVSYDPDKETVTVAVDLGAVAVPGEGKVELGRREIRLAELTDKP